MIYSFKDFIPVIHESSFVHPLAAVTGNVIIGKNCYIGPGAAIRGDWGQIILEDGVNVQENCTVHMFPGKSITLKESAHVGHGAIIHGANLGRNCLIGMNSVIMDDAEIGDESIIGAMSFVKAETKIPKRSLVVGNPAKVIKQVSDDMIAWKTKGTQLYQQLPTDCHESLREVQPLRTVPENRKLQEDVYKTLRDFMKK
ncbi:transferase hexapeptide repeat family protein [Subsaximicrobium wynnwilliamsii]|uniref:Transferase hexapeptide repeat family protein n=1 Tax=Subsaximicrobium wynnwilliamsii TaxID=291179 RepID=A0A5C6ZLR4_9FLAO|nr:transferase hexapeptide repeat family protein [Subsaximicrobium wynnwilliamsii]TXD85379.1 transferase hexapeptide repeat family protein [Subsaximicrobium wynnwilliamsii]TXD90732.1 transferase hexapeptide repeat family protein [Subsaximicrobium wynnwilliamsii]TXE05239.1 transferase hexapeptide repeat family protein [Subsaximicrobium wynnwilliamsii]